MITEKKTAGVVRWRRSCRRDSTVQRFERKRWERSSRRAPLRRPGLKGGWLRSRFERNVFWPV